MMNIKMMGKLMFNGVGQMEYNKLYQLKEFENIYKEWVHVAYLRAESYEEAQEKVNREWFKEDCVWSVHNHYQWRGNWFSVREIEIEVW